MRNGMIMFEVAHHLKCVDVYGTKYRSSKYRSSKYCGSEYRSSKYHSTKYRSSEYCSTKYRSSEYRSSKYRGSEYRSSKYRSSKFRSSKYPSSKHRSSEYRSSKYRSSKYWQYLSMVYFNSPLYSSVASWIDILFFCDRLSMHLASRSSFDCVEWVDEPEWVRWGWDEWAWK